MLQKNSHIKFAKIVINKKAYHNYFIEQIFQSGLELEGWEVKSIRLKKVNISSSYIVNFNNEMYLYNCIIQPLNTSSNHIFCNPSRKKKLLLQRNEINLVSMKSKNIGYTLIALSLFWKKSWCKLEFGLAKGKSMKDKRIDIIKKEWDREKLKILKKTKMIN